MRGEVRAGRREGVGHADIVRWACGIGAGGHAKRCEVRDGWWEGLGLILKGLVQSGCGRRG